MELGIGIVVAIGVVALVGVAIAGGGAPDIIDRSIGMYLFRRLTGRPTTGPAQPVAQPLALTADEVAHRIGTSGAPIPNAPVGSVADAPAARVVTATTTTYEAGVALERAIRNDPVRVASPAALVPPSPRQRLIRDAAFTVVGIAVLALVAVTVLPPGIGPNPPTSVFTVVQASVAGETYELPSTAEPTSAVPAEATASLAPTPSGAVGAETAAPTFSPTPTPTPIPP